MAAVDFSKILSKQAEAIEKPKPLPVGEYIAANPKLPDFKAVGKQDTPAAEFTLTIIAPTESVDPDHIAEFGGISSIKGKTVRYTQWLSENAEFRAKEELKNAFGIDEDGKTLGQMYNETINKNVIVTITHVPSEDGTEIFARATALALAD